MLYDVFISYSFKDLKTVSLLIKRLRREIPGIKIWNETDGAYMNDGYNRSEVIKGIEESKALIFVLSPDSLENEYCEKEVMYAYRKNKTIFPYLVQGMESDGWFLFEFGDVECFNAFSNYDVRKMVESLEVLIGRYEDSIDRTLGIQTLAELQSQLESRPVRSKSASVSEVSDNLEFDVLTGEFKQKSQSEKNLISDIDLIAHYLNGHYYVDLGLPSGLKWARCNIGAKKPEGYGEYFGWGKIIAGTNSIEDNLSADEKDIQWLRKNGFIDKIGNLAPEHDAARKLWGGSWRLPTYEEIMELKENTTSEWVNYEGVWGRMLKSKINDETLFLPAAGLYQLSSFDYRGQSGYYWCSTPNDKVSKLAYSLFFSDQYLDWAWGMRYKYYPIRPVSE